MKDQGYDLIPRGVVFFLSFALLAPSVALAQPAVVSRNVNLRLDPSTSQPRIMLLLPGDELRLLETDRTNGYYHVRTAGGEEGWAYGVRVRVLEDEPIPAPTTGPPEVFEGCLPGGSAQHASRRARNELKNRNTIPVSTDIDSTVTLAAILAPGDDATRWDQGRAASITGFVFDVKPGDRETVNCGAGALPMRDTHIELTLSATDTVKTRRVVLEVTPRWRAFFAPGVDWTTASLRAQFEGRCARFAGWLFFDTEHADESENTTPGGDRNFRATAWEIHPVTAIDVRPCP